MDYLIIYGSCYFGWLSYKMSFSLLTKLFDLVDSKLITSEEKIILNVNNNNFLLDDSIHTTNFSVAEQAVSIVEEQNIKNQIIDSNDNNNSSLDFNLRGGEDKFIEGVSRKKRLVDMAKALAKIYKKTNDGVGLVFNKVLTIVLSPIAKLLSILINNIGFVKKLYELIKLAKIGVSVLIAALFVKLYLTTEYLALLISGSLVGIPLADKATISSIYRMHSGFSTAQVCTDKVVSLVDKLDRSDISSSEKEKQLSDLFLMYEKIVETSLFKNAYFVCIIEIFLMLFISNNKYFRIAVRILIQLFKKGRISKQTYLEIIRQLLLHRLVDKNESFDESDLESDLPALPALPGGYDDDDLPFPDLPLPDDGLPLGLPGEYDDDDLALPVGLAGYDDDDLP